MIACLYLIDRMNDWSILDELMLSQLEFRFKLVILDLIFFLEDIICVIIDNLILFSLSLLHIYIIA